MDATARTALRHESGALAANIDAIARRYNALEPDIRAFVPESGRWSRLRREAAILANRFPHPSERPPLYGVLLGVKDIFHVDRMATHAGSHLPADRLTGPEAAVVTALKAAGMLVLGKTVTTEFAYFAPGPTRNPHHLGHTPGGSSSGSAAAVAAGLCPLALGTQTIGSINRPAAFCGVVGYKPSYERISREGVIPLSPSLDHVGFLGADVAIVSVAAAITADNWRAVESGERPTLGIPTGPYLDRLSPGGRSHFDGVCKRLRRAGYHVVEVPLLAHFAAVVDAHLALMAADATAVHKEWFAEFGDRYHTRTRALLLRGAAIEATAVRHARDGQLQLRSKVDAAMSAAGIDLWLTPSATGPAPAGLAATGDPIMNLPWTYAGLPTVTLPAGRDRAGLPLGIQLVAPYYQDEKLLVWAAALADDVAGGQGPGGSPEENER